MKIVFFGSTELGYECCEKLILGGQKVVGIFTIPKEFRISYSPGKPIKNYLFRDFTELGSKYKIPVFTVEGKLSDYANEVDAMKPDFMLAAGWYYMIPKSIRQIAAKGCAALHASLLPKYR